MDSQIFEFHFNPKVKDHEYFDSFVYKPENAYEKKLGSLYLAGDLENALPANSDLIEKISQNIRKNYYNITFKSSSKALSESLKKTNDFLSEQVSKENVSWLGNLNFAVLSIKDHNLSFTKTGDIKMIMIRQGQIIDLGQNLSLQDIEPYPLKIFSNIVSGKLAVNDILLILSKEVFDFFREQGILTKISEASEINQKTLKQILPYDLFTKGQEKTSGICLITLIQELTDKEKLSFVSNIANHTKEILVPEKKKFAFLLSPIYKIKKKVGQSVQPILKPFAILKKIRVPKIKIKNPLKPKQRANVDQVFSQKPKIQEIKVSTPKTGLSSIKKRLILIIVLLSILGFGYLIFKQTEIQKQKKIEVSLSDVQEKFDQAERFIIFREKDKANNLLMEVWTELQDLVERDPSLEPNITELKESTQEKLEELNNLEIVEDPQLLIELNSEIGFEPKKMLLSDNNIFFHTPDSSKTYRYNIQDNNGIILETDKSVDLADNSDQTIFFFSRPNTITILKNGDWQEKTLDLLDQESNFTTLFTYASNLYFWEQNSQEIVKYSYTQNNNWKSPQNWIKSKPENQKNIKSIFIDESIWLLNQDNSVIRYYKGEYQETIDLSLFPLVENLTKLKTKSGIPYLYFLEPKNNRLIITDRNGLIVKQFQSDKFNNLKDFIISDTGKTIYLLSDWNVYIIEF